MAKQQNFDRDLKIVQEYLDGKSSPLLALEYSDSTPHGSISIQRIGQIIEEFNKKYLSESMLNLLKRYREEKGTGYLVALRAYKGIIKNALKKMEKSHFNENFSKKRKE